MKKTRTLLISLILLLSLVLFLSIKYLPVFVIIQGDDHEIVEVNSDYVDKGAIDRFTKENISPIGQVDINTIGTYKIGYKSFIQTLYKTVDVVDTNSPVLTLNGRDIFIPLNENYIDPGVTITDNYDLNLENNLIINDNTNINIPGVYQITYDVSDNSNNKAQTLSRNVYVFDDDFNYLKDINDSYNLDDSIWKCICDFLNLYYKSLKYLKTEDLSVLFDENYMTNAYLTNSAIDSLVTYRNNSYNDLRLDDCAYSLNCVNVTYPSFNKIKVTFTENSDVKFHHLNGIESKQYKVYNYFTLINSNDGYKLCDVSREEGVFLYFERNYHDGTLEQIDEIKNNYLDLMNSSYLYYEEERKAVNEGLVAPNISVNNAYNRKDAKTYAIQYGNTRNSYYDDYSSNCVNFVSQCMYAGGLPMDSLGQYQWKFYNSVHDEINENYGFSYAWTYIPSFVEYFRNGDIVNMEDINLYFGETGDVLAVDNVKQDISRSPHVILISDQVYDDNGDIIDLLICGNTNDQVNYPISAMTYAYKNLIKIEGYN